MAKWLNIFLEFNIGTNFLFVFFEIQVQTTMGDFVQTTANIFVAGGGQFCQILFPSQYNSKKGLLIIKNGWNLNILRHIHDKINDKDIFQLQESIEFADQYIYGIMSDDGEYLIIWNSQSQQISIKKFK
ncbi:unnamed protein product [Paramecium octaurelia]|uniref:Uncharacterized protein n=1 Tax=Paramecium octaurelia TaxID=43137 RepID=A0A8S1Y133_PAROT|nr:unnamed protein product [Paramecium octaurelia]CAD8207442.1 unnamed protein product [Paramecium octaurelia]